MIVVTGAAGFIGSCLAKELARENKEMVLVDDFSKSEKAENLQELANFPKIERTEFFDWLETEPAIETIYHIGARTDTTEFDYSILEELNLEYTKKIWKYCADNGVNLIYASSAATYGDGELGYEDSHVLPNELVPLNAYGVSKNEFDKWALVQKDQPPHWYGLKFFNVYGPNEYHKGRMASVIMHAFNQIKKTGEMKLFRSHNPAYKNGEQLRDFIYVKDVVSVIEFLANNTPQSGLYNLGTGCARTFLDLTVNVFKAMGLEDNIGFIDTPADIRDKYQYFTEADMTKLKSAGYTKEFYNLEAGVHDYVTNYLMEGKYY